MDTVTLFDTRRLLQQEPGLTVIETLPDEFYDEFHLPGAKNVPLDDRFEESARRVAPDPSKPVLVYGLDRKSDAPVKAAQRLERLGYARVYVFPGGKIEWKENGLATE
ncbi:MAG TPA: rhodanese-like domain-containing protein [Planctomycetaceae bacterium]